MQACRYAGWTAFSLAMSGVRESALHRRLSFLRSCCNLAVRRFENKPVFMRPFAHCRHRQQRLVSRGFEFAIALGGVFVGAWTPNHPYGFVIVVAFDYPAHLFNSFLSFSLHSRTILRCTASSSS